MVVASWTQLKWDQFETIYIYGGGSVGGEANK